MRNQLLKNYTKEIHPVKNHDNAVKVDIGMALIHLSLDEKKSVLEVDGWMRMNWTDEYLSWNPKNFGGREVFHLLIF